VVYPEGLKNIEDFAARPLGDESVCMTKPAGLRISEKSGVEILRALIVGAVSVCG